MPACKYCAEPLPKNKFRCHSCQKWQTQLGLSVGALDGTVLLGDAHIRPMRRIDLDWLNPHFGGGLATTGVTLLGGAPGAGKSTLALQIANKVITAALADQALSAGPRKEIEALIISAEQFLSELRTMVENLELEHIGRFRMMPMLEGFTANVDDTILARRPTIVIADSLPKFTGGDHKVAVEFCEACKLKAIELSCPFIVIDHVTKDHTLAGLMELQHAVDTTQTLFQRNEGDAERVYVTKKNRFGPDHKSCLTMSHLGLHPCPGCQYCGERVIDDSD